MKKKFLIFMLLIAISSEGTPPVYAMSINSSSERWPEFFSKFYSALETILNEVKEGISYVPQALYHYLIEEKNHHSGETAYVRYSEFDDIGTDERDYLALRMQEVKKNLESFLEIKLNSNKIPRIGMVFSGGGFRAMLATLGFLSGAEQIGLLDSTVYCAGLSGSTWALAPWVASGKKVDEFKDVIINKLSHGIDEIAQVSELTSLLQVIVTKLLCHQHISAMDIYGALLANTLLRGILSDPLSVTMSNSHKQVMAGTIPMPIYTAIQGYMNPYRWMEFTPFEVGSSFLKSYIPIWAYGREFQSGSSQNNAPEQTLGYFMGTFGSAFEVNLRDLVNMSILKLSSFESELPNILKNALKKCFNLILDSFVGEIRVFPSILANFTYLYDPSPIKESKTIELIDAGIDFNLPFPPLLRPARNVDIIIVYDASSDQTAWELERAVAYAQTHGIKFPKINIDQAKSQLVSVFKDTSDPEVPVVIYFPFLKNPQFDPSFDPEVCMKDEYCNTFNFKYDPTEAKTLSDFSKFVIHSNKELVQGAIKETLVKKFGYKDSANPMEQQAVVA